MGTALHRDGLDESLSDALYKARHAMDDALSLEEQREVLQDRRVHVLADVIPRVIAILDEQRERFRSLLEHRGILYGQWVRDTAEGTVKLILNSLCEEYGDFGAAPEHEIATLANTITRMVIREQMDELHRVLATESEE